MLVAVGVVALDALTKWWALATLADRDIELVGSLQFHLVRNTGGAFSTGADYAPVFAVVGVVVVGVLLVVGRRTASVPSQVAFGLVAGGAVGNLLDRFLREGGGLLGGAVVDFVDLGWWPVFNLADVGITVGVVLLVLDTSRGPRRAEP